jgi:hypothetical protein
MFSIPPFFCVNPRSTSSISFAHRDDPLTAVGEILAAGARGRGAIPSLVELLVEKHLVQIEFVVGRPVSCASYKVYFYCPFIQQTILIVMQRTVLRGPVAGGERKVKG